MLSAIAFSPNVFLFSVKQREDELIQYQERVLCEFHLCTFHTIHLSFHYVPKTDAKRKETRS